MTPTENRRPLKSRSKPWAKALAKLLVACKVQPNHISIAGIVFSVIGGALLLAHASGGMFLLLAVALCIQARLLCNLMDGLVAVEGGLKSNYGDLYNEIPDRIADAVLLVCAGYAAESGTTGWLCAVLAVFTAYLRVFGGSLGQKQDFCGPMAKQHRMFVLTLGCLFASLNFLIGGAHHALLVALWIIAAGTAATSVRRIMRIAKNTVATP
jgi:phosphatidylglycerophosphate synthase